MSDNDNNGTPKSSTAWTEHDLLVCVLNTIERNNIKLDFSNTPLPPGRNANGLRQKINALKRNIKAEMDALNEGHPLPNTVATPPKKSGGRKRKAVEGDDAGEQVDTPKKSCARPKKSVSEPIIKDEPDLEAGREAGTEEEF